MRGQEWPRCSRSATRQHDDFARTAFDHFRQCGAASMHNAHHVGIQSVFPGVHAYVGKCADRAQYGRRTDQHMRAAENYLHAFDGGPHLLEIPNVGADP